jgi:hypothetical protein
MPGTFGMRPIPMGVHLHPNHIAGSTLRYIPHKAPCPKNLKQRFLHTKSIGISRTTVQGNPQIPKLTKINPSEFRKIWCGLYFHF